MDKQNLVKNTLDQIPQADPNAKRIVGLVKEGGRITGYKLSNETFVSKPDAVSMAKQGQIGQQQVFAGRFIHPDTLGAVLALDSALQSAVTGQQAPGNLLLGVAALDGQKRLQGMSVRKTRQRQRAQPGLLLLAKGLYQLTAVAGNAQLHP